MNAAALYVPRALDLAKLAGRKSLFLFGPRQTGKTALVRHALPQARVYDLLDADVFLTLSRRPTQLGEELGPSDRLVVLDEIQKLPVLLDEVHRLIEQRRIRFVLTGSSAQAAPRRRESPRRPGTELDASPLHLP
jgi:predicted AAA+ superfamily ATPase